MILILVIYKERMSVLVASELPSLWRDRCFYGNCCGHYMVLRALKKQLDLYLDVKCLLSSVN